jgi:hypothetical protein
VDERAQRVVKDVGREAVIAGGDRLVVARREVLEVAAAQKAEDLVLVNPRVAAEEIRQRVAVRRHEVDRARRRHRGRDRVPPPLRRALVVVEAAVEQAHEQVAVVREHVLQDVVRARAERAAQPDHAGRIAAERTRQRRVVGDVGDSRREQPLSQLVPLELVGGHDRDQVVDVRGRRDERCQGRLAIPAKWAPATARADDLPALDRQPGGPELLRALPEDDAPDPGHAVGQATRRVGERREIRPLILGTEVQARAREQVRFFERTHADVAARTEQRVVGTDIEIDLVARGAWRLAIHGVRVDHLWVWSAFLTGHIVLTKGPRE